MKLIPSVKDQIAEMHKELELKKALAQLRFKRAKARHEARNKKAPGFPRASN